jgi:MFS-type transporter involved in bile tolerance (Atg22 family)
VFGKENYLWLIISIAVVTFGFVLMSGTTDIYSTTKIVIAPVVVLAGFGLGFYAILKKPTAKA